MTIERRIVLSEVETRMIGDNRLITGYAYKFNSLSQNLGGFREMILPGAGAESAKADDIRALVNHDANLILGRNRAGTLRMAEDSTGLHYEITADDRQSYVRDLLISLERGDVTQSSFGFRVAPQGETWSQDADGFPLRSISNMNLFDVSPVTYPAYLSSESQVAKRALDMAAELTEVRESWTPPEPPALDERAVAIRALLARHSLRG